MFVNKISNEEVQELPRINFEGEVIVVESYDEMQQIGEYLMTFDVLGFDTESRVSFKKGEQNSISLLQISAGNRAFLFRLNRVNLTKHIIRVLESNKIKKIGVALKDDIRQLQIKGGFTPSGFVDLQKVVNNYGIGELSLKKICAIVLGASISKAQRLSNWNAQQLTEAQLVYAATDAWVCEQIYRKLIEYDRTER